MTYSEEKFCLITRDLTAMLCALQKKSRSCTLDLNDLTSYVERYAEPWRYWHVLSHIGDGFSELYHHEEHIQDILTLQYCELHHDIIWIPGSPLNEPLSAQYGVAEKRRCNITCLNETVVAQTINATRDHLVPENYEGNVEDLKIFLDIDLMGLGAPHDEYVTAGKLLRKEFAHVADEEFNQGRAAFSQRMLDRPTIYLSDHYTHLEDRARKNLQWAVEQASK